MKIVSMFTWRLFNYAQFTGIVRELNMGKGQVTEYHALVKALDIDDVPKGYHTLTKINGWLTREDLPNDIPDNEAELPRGYRYKWKKIRKLWRFNMDMKK